MARDKTRRQFPRASRDKRPKRVGASISARIGHSMRPIRSAARRNRPCSRHADYLSERLPSTPPTGSRAFSLSLLVLSLFLSRSRFPSHGKQESGRQKETRKARETESGHRKCSFPAGRREGKRGRQRAFNRKYSLMDSRKRSAGTDVIDAPCIETRSEHTFPRRIPTRRRRTRRVALRGRRRRKKRTDIKLSEFRTVAYNQSSHGGAGGSRPRDFESAIRRSRSIRARVRVARNYVIRGNFVISGKRKRARERERVYYAPINAAHALRCVPPR